MKIGVIIFPGSNCDRDALYAVERVGADPVELWHADADLKGVDAVILPGGFSYGDYLRPGAIARFAKVMTPLEDFARSGGPTLGICNGFQVLTEAGLLAGALQKNRGSRFLCAPAELVVASTQSALTCDTTVGEILRLPINHFEGNYTCSAETLNELRAANRVVLRYVRNPNGSMDHIAGVCSAQGNVVGLMPHPERASDPLLGSADGRRLLQSMLMAASRPVPAR